MAKPNYSRTLQLWPRGKSVTVRGDACGPDLQIRSGNRWRKATPEDRRAVRIEELAEIYVERDVLACQSSLVDDLLRNEQDGFSLEDVDNLYPHPDGWDAEECAQYLDDRGIEYPEEPDPFDEEDDRLDILRELVRQHAEPQEPYEWWLVTNWLARQLKQIGEPVLDNDYGTWWGRCCTGQCMIQDGTFQQIAEQFADC